MCFAVKSRKQCEIGAEVVKTCPSKLANAVPRPEIGPAGSNYPEVSPLYSPCAHTLDFIDSSLFGCHVRQLAAARVNAKG